MTHVESSGDLRRNNSLRPTLSRPCPGAAARAAAAAAASQTTRRGVGRMSVMRGDSVIDRDAESGIGIEIRESGEVISSMQNDDVDLSIVRQGPSSL